MERGDRLLNPPFSPIPYFLSLNLSYRFIIYFFLFFFWLASPFTRFYSLSLYLTWFDSYVWSRRSMMWCCHGSSQLSLLTLPSVASRFSSFSRFRNRYRIASFFFYSSSYSLSFDIDPKKRTSFLSFTRPSLVFIYIVYSIIATSIH